MKLVFLLVQSRTYPKIGECSECIEWNGEVNLRPEMGYLSHPNPCQIPHKLEQLQNERMVGISQSREIIPLILKY